MTNFLSDATKLLDRAESMRESAPAITGFDLRNVAWPTVDHYGYQHGNETSQLAWHIARGLDVGGEDLEAVKIAALLHDIGREQPWQAADPYHGRRSAELAGKLLRGSDEFRSRHSIVEKVEELIGRHSLHTTQLPDDPRLRAMWDADSYESARFAPNTVEGLKLFQSRTSTLCTPWARERQNKKTWLHYRGWRT